MSTDISYCYIGTAFEPLPTDLAEAVAAKRAQIKAQDLPVTDAQGRRRFHGAFTGGFSAGYFNTVGSKEGWAPKTFKSSRSSKKIDEPQAAFEQRPEDFMDEEDMGEFGIAPRQLLATQDFALQPQSESRAQLGGVLKGPVPQDLIAPSHEAAGVRLLQRMGWRPGQGAGPRLTHAQWKRECRLRAAEKKRNHENGHLSEDEEDDNISKNHTFAPRAVEVPDYVAKTDLFGIGYSPLQHPSALLFDNGTASSSKARLHMSDIISTQRHQRGTAGFGIGALDEDDDFDVYGHDNMAQYDRILGASDATVRRALKHPSLAANAQQSKDVTGGPHCHDGRPPLQNFMLDKSDDGVQIWYAAPKIPDGYVPRVPLAIKSDNTQPAADKPTSVNLTAGERGQMLGEEEKKKSVFAFLKEEDRRRIEKIREAQTKPQSVQPEAPPIQAIHATVPPATAAAALQGHFKPFAKDVAKQARYELFLRSQAASAALDPRVTAGLTEWEAERELDEFVRAALLFRPMSAVMSSRFVSASKRDDEHVMSSPTETSKQQAQVLQGATPDQTTAAQMKMYGNRTRIEVDWVPASLLCKRLGVLDPYRMGKEPNRPVHTGLVFSTITRDQPATMPEQASDGASKADATAELTKDKDTQIETLDAIQERPDMDLFKAIFQDSDSDTTEVSSDEEETINTSEKVATPEPEDFKPKFMSRTQRAQTVVAIESSVAIGEPESATTIQPTQPVQTEEEPGPILLGRLKGLEERGIAKVAITKLADSSTDEVWVSEDESKKLRRSKKESKRKRRDTSDSDHEARQSRKRRKKKSKKKSSKSTDKKRKKSKTRRRRSRSSNSSSSGSDNSDSDG